MQQPPAYCITMINHKNSWLSYLNNAISCETSCPLLTHVVQIDMVQTATLVMFVQVRERFHWLPNTIDSSVLPSKTAADPLGRCYQRLCTYLISALLVADRCATRSDRLKRGLLFPTVTLHSGLGSRSFDSPSLRLLKHTKRRIRTLGQMIIVSKATTNPQVS